MRKNRRTGAKNQPVVGENEIADVVSGWPKEYDLSGSNDLPAELEKLIVTVRDRYAYLFA